MSLADTISKDLLTIESDLGNPLFQWDGENYNCVPGVLNSAVSTGQAVFEDDSTFKMTVRLDQFGDGVYPALNQNIVYQNVTMKIKGIAKPPHNAFWVYSCEIPKVT